MRPIDADYARAKLISAGRAIKGTADSKRFTKLIGILVDRIDAAPNLDYAPARHGEWIEDDTPFTRQRKCSLCGRCDNPKTAIRGRFCWYCGALMDGGKKDG